MAKKRPIPIIGGRKKKQVQPKVHPVRHFLREWRDYRGLTQAVAADRLSTWMETEKGLSKGYTRESLSRIESGEVPYSQVILEGLAYVYQTDPGSLIMRDPQKVDEGSALYSIWDQAKIGDRKKIIEIAKTIVGTGTEG